MRPAWRRNNTTPSLHTPRPQDKGLQGRPRQHIQPLSADDERTETEGFKPVDTPCNEGWERGALTTGRLSTERTKKERASKLAEVAPISSTSRG